MRFFAACGLVVATMLVFFASSATAQVAGFDPSSGKYDVDAPERRGQAGMAWLRIGGSARVEGMGGSAIGLQREPSLVFYNPAGAATLPGIAVYGNNTRWPGDVRVNHFAALFPAGPVVIGGLFQSMDFGTIIGTAIDETEQKSYRETGDVGVDAWTAGLTVASQVTDRFSAGLNIKYAVEDFDDTNVYSFVEKDYIDKKNDNRISVWALDVGTQYNTGLRNISLNMSFANLATTVNYIEQDFDLPLTYQVGFSFDALEVATGDAFARNKLHVEIAGVDRRDVPLDVAFGVEYTGRLLDSDNILDVALRAGRRPARNQNAWLSYGGGVAGVIAGVRTQLDYSYNDYGDLFDTHRVSLTVYLDR